MGTLRVISGSAKGIRLKTVPGDTTRPITDQVKEALFNILGNSVEGTVWLDLFGGTGAVGIEALSRYADFVTFLDLSFQAVRVINENLLTTQLSEYAEVFKRDAFDFLPSPPPRTYDVIYIAPPQYKQLWQKALILVDQNPAWLNENARVIVQINPLEWTPQTLENLTETAQRRYGDTLLVFFEKNQSNEMTHSSAAL